jgi:hypothetical protein
VLLLSAPPQHIGGNTELMEIQALKDVTDDAIRELAAFRERL